MRLIAGILVAAACLALAAAYLRQPPGPAGPVTVAAPPPAAPPTAAAAEAVAVYEPVRGDIRNVTPDHVLPGPHIEAELIRRLPAAPPPPAAPPAPISWPRAEVVSAGLLRSGATTIAIAGIDPLAAATECRLPDGATWPCGRFARAALRRLVRQRPVECDPAGEAVVATQPAPMVTHCRVAGRDIGQWLVSQGWALPLPGSGHDEALQEARAAGRGQWRTEAPALPQGF